MKKMRMILSDGKLEVKAANKGSFVLMKGDLLTSKADIIACPVASTLFARTVLATEIFEKNKPLVGRVNEVRKGKHVADFPLGTARLISAHDTGLNAKGVSLVVVDEGVSTLGKLDYIQIVKKAVENTLTESDARDMKSVAFPILNSFRGVFTGTIIDAMFTESMKYLNESSAKVKNIMLVVLPETYYEAEKAVFNAASDLVWKKE
ncbi:MAG: hypothetical protein WC861_06210 [Candidatus Micrarchaeia archaeon]|jgi:O-acetyl-ADP-ribose deacetylase (regulator of RNase III)